MIRHIERTRYINIVKYKMSDSDFELYLLDTSSNEDTDTTFTISSNSSDEVSECDDCDEISIASSISCKTAETMQLFDSFHDEDMYDIIEDIYDQIDDYYNDNMIKMSSPKFYTDMFKSISEVIYNEWENIEICDWTKNS